MYPENLEAHPALTNYLSKKVCLTKTKWRKYGQNGRGERKKRARWEEEEEHKRGGR